MKSRLFFLSILIISSLTILSNDRRERIVVIGFDGADAGITEKLMSEGKLPNLLSLKEKGYYSRLNVTNPPQTPVSWSSFLTGQNPGKTQIFDFLRRNPETYKPSFALNEESSKPFFFGNKNRLVFSFTGVIIFFIVWLSLWIIFNRRIIFIVLFIISGIIAFLVIYRKEPQYIPERIPYPINHRLGKPFWEILGRNGDRCFIFRVPATFPAVPFEEGKLFSGLGVPDMRGRVGTPYIFTSDVNITGGDNEFSVEIVPLESNVGTINTSIKGPFNKPFYEYYIDEQLSCVDPKEKDSVKEKLIEKMKERKIPETIDIPMIIKMGMKNITLNVQENSVQLGEGQWSQWIHLDFRINSLIHLYGMVRFYLQSIAPEIKLYMSPIHFDPEHHIPSIPFCTPKNLSKYLVKKYGIFKTMGWAVDTWAISSGLSDEKQFLEDMYDTVDSHERIMAGILKNEDIDTYVQVYEFTDRIGHIFYRFLDKNHPLYNESLAKKYGIEVEKAYERMDAIVGNVISTLGKNDVLFVLSDHGFTSFRWAVNLNTFLVKNGYMVMNDSSGTMTLEDLFDDNRLLFKNVDWSKTRAYGIGLGNIYINLKGREKNGIVNSGKEYDELCREIRDKLEAWIDEKTGEHPILRVYRRDEIYNGFDPMVIPDLRVSNSANYRVSWQTSLGGVPPELIEPNLKPWSGDHCSIDPSLVKGVLFSNIKIKENPNIIDLAPTILNLRHISAPKEMDGKSLLMDGKS